ncbi:MAG: PAS domain S-box protein [Alphaproteobacteria bacterium]|nr:PAS domain S-box protein [Alphaproteobacteria bacterium]
MSELKRIHAAEAILPASESAAAPLLVLAVAGEQEASWTPFEAWRSSGAKSVQIAVHTDPRQAFAAAMTDGAAALFVALGDVGDAPILSRILAWSVAPVIAVVPPGATEVVEVAFALGAEDVIEADTRPREAIRTLLHCIMRSRSRASRQSVRAAENDRAIMLVQEAAEGLVILDHDGHVRFINDAAADLLGRTQEELTGTKFPFNVVTGEPARIEVTRPDGEMRTAELRFIETEWGGVPARLGSLADVSVRLALESAVSAAGEAQAEIHAHGVAAQDLAGSVRTRLTTIIGFAELMLNGAFGTINNARYLSYLADIRDSGFKLLSETEALQARPDATRRNAARTKRLASRLTFSVQSQNP